MGMNRISLKCLQRFIRTFVDGQSRAAVCGNQAPALLTKHVKQQLCHTLPETNITPENWWLEDEFPFGMASWQVLC